MIPFLPRDLLQRSTVTPMPCWMQPDSLGQGLSPHVEKDGQAFLWWLLSTQRAEVLLGETRGANVVSHTFLSSHLGERGMGDGNALWASFLCQPLRFTITLCGQGIHSERIRNLQVVVQLVSEEKEMGGQGLDRGRWKTSESREMVRRLEWGERRGRG